MIDPPPRDIGHVKQAIDPANEAAMQATSVLDLERLKSVLAKIAPADRQRACDGLRILAEACQKAREEHEASSKEQDGWKKPQWDGGDGA